jgi:hypothetical protein
MLKQCPKCRGDLYVERDTYGRADDLRCLQCGKALNREEILALRDRRRLAAVA